ncbi:DUF7289 family protein [Haloarcula amylovorans]|uniref:DUF7289 family protein n=1 Tax=Haloarcula amylovorans TaxID=2562280 RepID=UPI001076127E|nr:hypothetical protein [Halomicroarcula amylolytica]
MTDRAVSEVLSYTLIFGIVVTSIALVSVTGVGALQDTRNAEQVDNAERAFDVLADNVADIHRHGAPSRATEVSLGEGQLVVADNVTVSVSVDEGSGFNTVGSWTVRPVEYGGVDDQTLAYEAGGVFRTTRDGGVRVRKPPFVVSNERVLLPVVGLNRPTTQSLGGSTVLVRTKEERTDVVYADTSSTVDGVRITIANSPRQSLWEEYFVDQGFTCSPGGSSLQCEYAPGSINRVYVVYHDISVEIDQ